jgi:transketolase
VNVPLDSATSLLELQAGGDLTAQQIAAAAFASIRASEPTINAYTHLAEEAAMAAANFKVNNLVAIVDHNGYQQTAAVTEVTDPSMYVDKWRAFGWNTVEIDGHDLHAAHKALVDATDYRDGPAAIIAHTKKGKGVSFLETDFTWHGRGVPKDQLEKALEEIG